MDKNQNWELDPWNCCTFYVEYHGIDRDLSLVPLRSPITLDAYCTRCGFSSLRHSSEEGLTYCLGELHDCATNSTEYLIPGPISLHTPFSA